MNFFTIHATFVGKPPPPCKIGAQLFTDAFGHEIHRPHFPVDSVNRAIFKFCAKQED